MSSITPPSFVDDGGSFTKRIPRSLDERQKAKWISNSSSETSRYTGSFVDDGADMHFRSGATPGFGPIDTRFYKQKKRKESKRGEKMWNDDVQRAISGDMHRNLKKMRSLRGLEVKRAIAKNGIRKGVEKDTVTVPMPLQWGAFIIKSDDGRVIIVDKDGEFDSGPQRIDDEKEQQRQRPWVKAASTLAPPSPPFTSAPPPLLEHHDLSKQQKEKGKSKSRDKKRCHKSSRHSHHSPQKALIPIMESEYEDGYLSSDGKDIGSPTGFMMTGGASEWPSRTAAYTASPTGSVSDGYEYIASESMAKKVRDGYRHVKPVSHSYDYTFPKSSPLKNAAKAVSNASWNGGQFEDAWEMDSPARTNKSDGSRRRGKSTESPKLKDVGNVSAKSHSTYKAPTVEDAPSTSSASNNGSTKMGWGDSPKKSHFSQKGDDHSFRGSMNNDQDDWTSLPTFPHSDTWACAPSQPISEQSWTSRPKAADNPAWTGVKSFTSKQYAKSTSRASSATTWDGYEVDKTLSDISVAGSGSERGSLHSSSQVSHQSPTRDRHGSRASHGGSSGHSAIQPSAWEDDQVAWTGSQHKHHGNNSSSPKRKTSVQDSNRGWEDAEQSGSARSTRSTTQKYANGFDEDNATYLNGNWGGTPVRITTPLSYLPSQRHPILNTATSPPRLGESACRAHQTHIRTFTIAISTSSTLSAMATFTRQPFAELGTSRLQVLQSAKNRQNAMSNLGSPQSLKSTPGPSTGKRQRAPEIYEDADSENMDPFIFNSPTKKSKTTSSSANNDAGYVKPAKFSIFTSPSAKTSASLHATPSVPSTRKALSSPNTAKSTPITTSRGSPKNKRLHAISKRRASTSPFRRVDPPCFTQSSPSLPFSIDAALSGSISTYTPKAASTVTATPASAPAQQASSALDETMPKGWFFEIHEDSPEQEAANLMEHSASILDISSDDDVETRSRNEDRGKENVPPPDFLPSQQRSLNASSALDVLEDDGYETEILVDEPIKRPRLRRVLQDAMDEDRKPLGDLAPCEFYADGCDATSYVTVDAGIEKPSRLSREVGFSDEVIEEEKGDEKEEKEDVAEGKVEEVAAQTPVAATSSSSSSGVDEVPHTAQSVAGVTL
ncbi:dephospho-CoA kinase [Stemphylium lycopersici]|nr:dephospho-CoA kinase [Stemphylium lycopersici]